MKSYTPPRTTDLTLTRTIAARPEELYDVWLDPKSPGGPWHGCVKLLLDARVDGLFYHAGDFEGRRWHHYGRFVALERGRRIEHTWVSEGTRGLESVVTITFEPEGEKTRMTLRHAGVPDDDFGRQHADGWGWMLGILDEQLAQRRR